MKIRGKSLAFSVIGAGHGGQGIAAYLSWKGYSVNLYNRSLENIMEIKQKGYIDMEGEIQGRGYLNKITNDIHDAIKNTDVIMVVLPANAHKSIAHELVPYVEENQYIVLNPGRTGGALEISHILRGNNFLRDICVVEAQTLLFACRSLGQGKVKIFSKKQEVKVAALPAVKTQEFINLMKDAIEEFNPVESVLETSFNNIGAVLHPIPTILNCGRIENTGGDFQYYIDGITPSVAKIIEKVDQERMMVAYALGVNTVSLRQWLQYTYYSFGDDLCELLKNTKGYWGIKAPSSIDTRYIFEDVPQSLVPISDMARHLGFHTPTIDSMIYLASIIHNRDYYRNGRKVNDMGLSGLSLEEIRSFVINGEKFDPEGVVA